MEKLEQWVRKYKTELSIIKWGIALCIAVIWLSTTLISIVYLIFAH